MFVNQSVWILILWINNDELTDSITQQAENVNTLRVTLNVIHFSTPCKQRAKASIIQ